jgi:hypothetical protein
MQLIQPDLQKWPMTDKQKAILELTIIPGVGTSIANDLWRIGIKSISDLKSKNAEYLYELSNEVVGVVQDRCLLYTFRCAVYFATTDQKKHDPEKLKWWNWKDVKPQSAKTKMKSRRKTKIG